jgi:hypothetical protein
MSIVVTLLVLFEDFVVYAMVGMHLEVDVTKRVSLLFEGKMESLT